MEIAQNLRIRISAGQLGWEVVLTFAHAYFRNRSILSPLDGVFSHLRPGHWGSLWSAFSGIEKFPNIHDHIFSFFMFNVAASYFLEQQSQEKMMLQGVGPAEFRKYGMRSLSGPQLADLAGNSFLGYTKYQNQSWFNQIRFERKSPERESEYVFWKNKFQEGNITCQYSFIFQMSLVRHALQLSNLQVLCTGLRCICSGGAGSMEARHVQSVGVQPFWWSTPVCFGNCLLETLTLSTVVLRAL